MSLRVKTLLIVLAALAVMSPLFALIAANAISGVQAQYEADVIETTRAQFQLLYQRLQEDLMEAEVDLDSEEGRQVLEVHVRQVLEPGNDYVQILLGNLMSTQGTLVISNDRGRLQWSQTDSSDFDEAVRRVARPLYARGQYIGVISFKVNSDKILHRLQLASREVRRSLTGLSLALLVLMLVTFYLLWKTFKRHMETTVKATQLKQMAYVGSLAGGLAHEIRNPLHAMGINLAVVEEEILDPRATSPERILRIVRNLRRQVDELNGSVTSFLEFARPERQRAEAVDVADLLRQVCLKAASGLEAIGGRLEWQLAADLPRDASGAAHAHTLGQPASLMQAFTNIVTNAIQAMDEWRRAGEAPEGYQPIVSISLSKRAGFYVITIRDNGPGIPAGDHRRIFEVFYSQRPGGSGFGLAIAQRVFMDHGGRIWVESTPGEGAAFHMLLPLSASQQENRPSAPSRP